MTFKIKYIDIPKSARDNFLFNYQCGKEDIDVRLLEFNGIRENVNDRRRPLTYVFETEQDYMFFLLKYL